MTTLCSVEDNKLKQIKSKMTDKLPMINDRFIKVTKNKMNTVESKYLGNRYDPYNYEVYGEKKNSCSLKDSFHPTKK